MLKTRIISAVIGLPLLYLLFTSEHSSAKMLFFLVINFLATRELAKAFLLGGSSFELKVVGLHSKHSVNLLAVFNTVLFFALSYYFTENNFKNFIVLLFSVPLAAITLIGVCSKNHEEGLKGMFLLLLCLFYILVPCFSMWWILTLSTQSDFLFLLLVIIWGSDTGAYFVGRTLGKHKLAPLISPSKTIEGAVGGVITSVALSFVFSLAYDSISNLGFITIMVIAISGSIFGQLGDLVESRIKRHCDIKDSGNIIPGHGGILDRIDGLLVSAPIYLLVLSAFLEV